MGQPYVGEIRMFAGTFAPAGWEFCQGQLLQISENDTLFNLIGTTYGGDGQSNFALPNLQSRVPLHQSNGYILGQQAGAETVTLTVNQIPSHTHGVLVSGSLGTSSVAKDAYFAKSGTNTPYTPDTSFALTSLKSDVITSTGGSQPHDNLQPYLVISFIISLYGVYPSQT